MRKYLPAFCQIVFLLFLASCDLGKAGYQQLEIQGATMGTYYSVKLVYGDDQKQPDSKILKQTIDDLLVDINQSMSTYIPSSELSVLNRMAELDAKPLSDALFKVLQLSQEVSEASSGAFDVTVYPLVELWGFGASKTDRAHVPSNQVVDATKERTGYQKLVLDAEAKRLSRPQGTTIDLSAVAKGYAVDILSERLKASEYVNHMVEIGGEVRARGFNQRGMAWRIGIETPAYSLMSAPQGPALIVQLSDSAMATSGDYRNYYEVDGQRFSHTIDPNTGRPITHNLASVTVIMPACASADAFATAFNVMGADAALALANQLDIAAFFIVKTKSGFDSISSKAFARHQIVATK